MGFWEPLFFWIFAVGAIASSAAVVIFRNPLYSALSLILDFFFFAALYALLSAHMMALTQVLVYAGAIMVLVLFIIMLLNLRDEELGEFEFKIHHIVSLGAVLGLFFFLNAAIAPLVDEADVRQGRQEAAKKHEAALKQAGEGGERPRYEVATKTAVKGPLYGDLNEEGLQAQWERRIKAYDSGRTSPSQAKWRRFDEDAPMVIPPAMTGEALETERGRIRKNPEGISTFGTIEPMSVLLVNRFVVPFELTALLLLAAIVGAVIIAKRRV